MTAHLPCASQNAANTRTASIATEQSCGDGVGDITNKWFRIAEYPSAGNYALVVPNGADYVLTADERATLLYPRDWIVDAGGTGDYTTLGAAIAAANNEDRILVKNGAYAPAYVSGSGYFVINKEITIQAYSGHTPVLTYSGTDEQSIVVVNAFNVVLRGLKIIGTYALGRPEGANLFGSCVSAYQAIVIEDCELTGFNHCGIKLFDGGTGTIIRRNHIHTGGYTSQDHALYIATHKAGTKRVIGNHMHDISGYGIHAYNYEYDVIAYGNVIHDNGGSGIYAAGERHKIYNNTCYANNKGIDTLAPDGLVVQNNICWGNSVHDMCIVNNGSATNMTFTHNDYHLEYTDGSTPSLKGNTGCIDSDPLFADATPTTIADFALQVGSPCRAAGTDESAAGVQGLDAAESALTLKAFSTWDMGAIAR